MFTVNRKESGSFVNKPGDYPAEIIKVEHGLTNKGADEAKVHFRTDDNEAIFERFQNMKSVYWKINALIAATELPIDDGAQIDLDKKGEFARFMDGFMGQRCVICVRGEKYVKDGEEREAMRVKSFRPAPKRAAAPVDDDAF